MKYELHGPGLQGIILHFLLAICVIFQAAATSLRKFITPGLLENVLSHPLSFKRLPQN